MTFKPYSIIILATLLLVSCAETKYVPDGSYSVYLYFADLTGPFRGKPMPYNLGNDALTADNTERVFSVGINGVTVLKDFDIAGEYGFNTAVIQKYNVDVCGGKGLSVDFLPAKGLAVLNAIRIIKIR